MPASKASIGECLVITLPIEAVSEANKHDHWTRKRKRRVANGQAVDTVLRFWLPKPARVPDVVNLHRLGIKLLDKKDNLPMAFKGIVDTLCRLWGIDDDESCPVDFRYSQERSRSIGIVITLHFAGCQCQQLGCGHDPRHPELRQEAPLDPQPRPNS